MKYALRFVCLLLAAAPICFAEEESADVKSDETRIVYTPTITNEALINPGMGWVFYQYSSRLWAYGSMQYPGDTLDWFPGCSTIYFRVTWSDLEPEEGLFRWDLIDTYARPWILKGKKIAFRVMVSNPTPAYTTPKWVRDAGAQGIDYAWDKNSLGSTESLLWEPKFYDPIFLEKLEGFLAAFARRYNGNPAVAFIDIGSFGIYGEGHTDRSQKLSPEETNRIGKMHIDLYKKYFPDTQLVIGDDMAGNQRRNEHAEITDYAFSQGVTLRDDSILCAPGENAWFSQKLAQQFWPVMPVIIEHGHYIRRVYKNNWTPERLPDAMEDYHASYFSIHDWPQQFLQREREIVDKMNLRLGYRIELRRASFPSHAKIDEPILIETDWANVGVAPCYGGAFPTFTLKDDEEHIVWSVTDESFNVRDLPVAAPGQAETIRHESRVRFGLRMLVPTINEGVIFPMKELGQYPIKDDWIPTMKPGTYSLWVSLGKPDGTPEIAMPIEGGGPDRCYKLGDITIDPAAGQ